MKKKPEIQSLRGLVVVGAHTILGELIIERLERDPRIESFYVFDLHVPKKREFKKLKFIKIDLTQPGADAHLADKFTEIGAHCVVHCALKNNPSHHSSEAHELEVIGTINILSACKAAQVKKFVCCSTTMVYGASSKNPNYIAETAPLAQNVDSHFVRDKIEAEKQISNLQREAPAIKSTVLRFCLIVGPHSRNYFTALLRSPIVPTLLGYDPLFQFIHETDAVAALERAIFGDHPGVFNIVGIGVIPLSYALREAGRIQLPIPSALAYPLVQSLWNIQMLAVPGKLLDYFRYLWVADGDKAARQMDFDPQYSSRDAFIELAKESRIQEYKWAQ